MNNLLGMMNNLGDEQFVSLVSSIQVSVFVMDGFIFVLGYTILLDLRECVSSEKRRKFD